MNKILYLILALTVVLEIAGVAFLAEWRSWFWDSVHNKDVNNFIKYLIEFTGVVLVLVIVTGYKSYLINYISLLIRKVITNRVLKDGYKKIEGFQQRIQEDIKDYPLLSLTIGTGLINSFIQILIFAYIIWSQTDIYNIGTVVIYATLGTLIAYKIAKPLIKLNYNNQVTEAAFRQKLDTEAFEKAFDNNYKLYIRLKYLQYFQSFFNQITVIIPLLILSYSYFHGIISFGVLMQLSACIGAIIDQGSYFINSFDQVNKWLSCKKRLKEMGIIQ